MKKQHDIDQNIKIIIIDDDDVDATLIERSLRSADIPNAIIRAYDGEEALDLLRGTNSKTKIAPPYLLLVDLNMPKMDGLTFIKQLREDSSLSQEIVFVLSSSKSDEERMEAYNLDIAGYIKKDRTGREFTRLAGILEHYYQIIESDKRLNFSI